MFHKTRRLNLQPNKFKIKKHFASMLKYCILKRYILKLCYINSNKIHLYLKLLSIQESLTSIMEIKFCNIVVEMMIENCMDLFSDGDLPKEGTLRKLKPAFVRLPSQR